VAVPIPGVAIGVSGGDGAAATATGGVGTDKAEVPMALLSVTTIVKLSPVGSPINSHDVPDVVQLKPQGFAPPAGYDHGIAVTVDEMRSAPLEEPCVHDTVNDEVPSLTADTFSGASGAVARMNGAVGSEVAELP
jgi:hypothetical protein